MTPHRALQRTLFRMQLDPGFADAIRRHDPAALRSTGLDAAVLRPLLAADPAALEADPGGRRRAQFLRNVTSEFPLSLAAARAPELSESFTRSSEFHRAVAEDRSLPLAFARHLAASHSSPLVVLEQALACARRARRPSPALSPGEVALAPWAELLDVPLGTLDAAQRVRAALDQGRAPPRPPECPRERETLLLRRTPEPAPFRLAEVEVERLSPAFAELLRHTEQPIQRAALAQRMTLSLQELERILADLVTDRVVLSAR